MKRYVSKSWVDHSNGEFWNESVPPAQAFTVFEEEDGPVHTGLLDEHGNPIMRINEKRRIGYL